MSELSVTALGNSPELPRLRADCVGTMNRLYQRVAGTPYHLESLAIELTPNDVMPVSRANAPAQNGDGTIDTFTFTLGPHAGHLLLSSSAQNMLFNVPDSHRVPLALRYALLADALADLSTATESSTGWPVTWIPHSTTQAEATPETPTIQFRVRHANSGRQGQGCIRIDHMPVVDALLNQWPQTSQASGAMDATDTMLDTVALPLSFELGRTSLSLREVQGIQAGDIVSIEHWRSMASAIGVSVCVGGRCLPTLKASAEGTRITIESGKDDMMTTATTATPAPTTTTQQTSALPTLDALEVPLQFQVGQLSISLGDLKSVAPGQVFELNEPLNRCTVRIMTHGKVLGTGHLVAIGDRLGVRVSEFVLSAHE